MKYPSLTVAIKLLRLIDYLLMMYMVDVTLVVLLQNLHSSILKATTTEGDQCIAREITGQAGRPLLICCLIDLALATVA
jgi:hypothetical protein